MIFFSLAAPGGSASVFLSLANALQNQGNEVDVYTYYWDKKNCFPELTKNLKLYSIKNINSYNLNNNSLFARFQLGLDYYFRAKKLGNLLKREKYDCLYASEASAYVVGMYYVRKNNIPLLWSVFDPISLVDNQRPGLIIHKYKWFRNLLTLHNYFDSKNIKKITKVIVPTTHMKKMLDRFYIISCAVLPTAGVRIGDYKKDKTPLIKKRLKEKFGFVKTKEIILYGNGHILPHRRYEDVLDAVVLLKKEFSIKYIISGSDKFDPSYYQFLQDKVKLLGLDKEVTFDTEFKTNDEIIGYYQYIDIFIFVSTEQTWGLAPFEAMAAKKPVILSQGVGASEVLTSQENAYIVKEKSPKEIAKTIKDILMNKKKAKKIAENGYKKVKEFSYAEIARKVEKLISSYLQKA